VKRQKRREKEFKSTRSTWKHLTYVHVEALDAERNFCNGCELTYLACRDIPKTEETDHVFPERTEENEPVAVEATATRLTRFESAWATKEEEYDDDDDLYESSLLRRRLGQRCRLQEQHDELPISSVDSLPSRRPPRWCSLHNTDADSLSSKA
jgi:hypothetical protein